MLHHLDLTHAYPELHRILKPGGHLLASEALNYNPLIQLYRRLTPEMRTDWAKEHIPSLKDVRAAKQYFEVGEIRYWHLSSVLGAFLRGVPSIFWGGNAGLRRPRCHPCENPRDTTAGLAIFL